MDWKVGRLEQGRGHPARTSPDGLDQRLQSQPWIAGERFTIADITAFCALEFARGLMKFVPGDEGMHALQAWRDRMNDRPSAKV